MTDGVLSDELARRILGWKATPDRYIMAGRQWVPKWRFNPSEHLEDAFLLLDRSRGIYMLSVTADGVFQAEVVLDGKTGKATGERKAHTVTLAIARSLGIEVT